MNIIENVKFRWNNCFAPPKNMAENYSFEHGNDEEKIMFLRRLRGLIGYGPGWTFVSALIEFFFPVFLWVLWVALVALYVYMSAA
jgi:hypothetical protein